jgi:hypothetical protein
VSLSWINHHAIKMYREVKAYLHTFLKLPLDEVTRCRLRPIYSRWNAPRYPLDRHYRTRSRSGRFAKYKYLLPVAEENPAFSVFVAMALSQYRLELLWLVTQ